MKFGAIASKHFERTRVLFLNSVADGSAKSAAAMCPWASAIDISGNGISVNLTESESPPFLSIHARGPNSAMFLRPLVAKTLPLKSLAVLIAEFCATTHTDDGVFVL